jgi:hypothetical protein
MIAAASDKMTIRGLCFASRPSARPVLEVNSLFCIAAVLSRTIRSFSMIARVLLPIALGSLRWRCARNCSRLIFLLLARATTG